MSKELFSARLDDVVKVFALLKPQIPGSWDVLGPKITQTWTKNVFFYRYFWTHWGAQASGMSPF